MKPALAFWLRAVEAGGGLAEPSADTCLVMLPRQLQDLFDLPAELEVCDDPDVARDVGAVLLGMGHPVIAKAADALLGEADVGTVELAAVSPAPDLATLQDKARQRFPVAHGRIDLIEPPQPDTTGVARLGALVRYTISDEDHYQEQLEQWVDTATRLPIAGTVVARLLTAERRAEAAGPTLDRPAVAESLVTAYQQIDAAAARRCAQLAADVTDDCHAELARAEAYYTAMLDSIAKRRATAAPDRLPLLDARADSTRAERLRRLEEIAEKYRGAYEVQPFRLHLMYVPALRLPGEVRRGERRYPLTLTWIPAAADFLPVACPSCGRAAPLDAGKTALGCISCHTKIPAQPAPPAERHAPAPPGNARRPAEPRPHTGTTAAPQPSGRSSPRRPRRRRRHLCGTPGPGRGP